MMNRRKLFSFLATAPVATVIGAKAAMDANGNDVAPLMRGDFWWPDDAPRSRMVALETLDEYIRRRELEQQFTHNSRSQSLRS